MRAKVTQAKRTIKSDKLRGKTMKAKITALFVLLFSCAAHGATVTIDAAAFGYYLSDYLSGGSTIIHGSNYAVGEVPEFFGANVELRNYSVFDLSSVNGTITSATVKFFNPATGFNSVYDPEAFGLTDVSTSISALTAGTGGAAAFSDLGSGIGVGGAFAGSSSNGTYVNVVLNAAGVAYLSGNLGGDIAFGGKLAALDNGFPEQRLFLSGSDLPLSNVQLVMEVVPVPAAAWLFGGALGALVMLKRRVQQ
jgi:hypothetical protein